MTRFIMADIKDSSELPEVVDPKTDKVHTWPHLVRSEFVCGLLAFFFFDVSLMPVALTN